MLTPKEYRKDCDQKAPNDHSRKICFQEDLFLVTRAYFSQCGYLTRLCSEMFPSANVERYLEQKLGEDLDRVEKAMWNLAKAYRPKELVDEAHPLYEKFRPEIPAGQKGWGAEGDLDLDLLEQLAKRE